MGTVLVPFAGCPVYRASDQLEMEAWEMERRTRLEFTQAVPVDTISDRGSESNGHQRLVAMCRPILTVSIIVM